MVIAPAVAQAQQTPQVAAPTDDARLAFERGIAALRERRFADAELALREALRLRPTPLAMYNLALALRGLGRYIEAADLFERYLREPETGAIAQRLDAIRSELGAMRASVASVDITLQPPSASVRVDGRVHPPGATRLLLDPGVHVFDVEADGYERDHRELTLAPGARAVVAVSLRAQSSDGRIIIEPSVPARVSIDGVAAGVGRVERSISAGDHVIEVSAQGHQPWRREVRVAPRAVLRMDVSLQATVVATASRPWLIPLIIGGSVLAVAGIATGVAIATRGDEAPVPGSWGNFIAP